MTTRRRGQRRGQPAALGALHAAASLTREPACGLFRPFRSGSFVAGGFNVSTPGNPTDATAEVFLVATDSYVRHDGGVLINAIPNGATQCYRARLVGMVRDAAGNESNAMLLSVQRTPDSLLDKAIAKEEKAEDEAVAGHYAVARREIIESLPFVARALARGTRGCHPGRAAHLAQVTGDIISHKAKAGAWITAARHTQAIGELRIALSLERQLAARADANGLSFEGP